jgi:hypothetical protein
MIETPVWTDLEGDPRLDWTDWLSCTREMLFARQSCNCRFSRVYSPRLMPRNIESHA